MRSLVFAAFTMLAGCSLFMHSIERPTATVRTASIRLAGFEGITGELQLDVANPNNFGVPISGIDWQLAIGGSRAATGTVQLSQTIPARGVAPITTSLTIGTRDALAAATAIANGVRNYQVTAQLHFSTTVGQLDVDVVYDGQIDVGPLLGLR